MPPGAIWGEGVPKPTGNAPRGGSIEGRPNLVWVISGDLDRFKRARVLGFIRPVVPLAGLPLYVAGLAMFDQKNQWKQPRPSSPPSNSVSDTGKMGS
jgi:hypothetical protein